jgi:hypothetical protein
MKKKRKIRKVEKKSNFEKQNLKKKRKKLEKKKRVKITMDYCCYPR